MAEVAEEGIYGVAFLSQWKCSKWFKFPCNISRLAAYEMHTFHKYHVIQIFFPYSEPMLTKVFFSSMFSILKWYLPPNQICRSITASILTYNPMMTSTDDGVSKFVIEENSFRSCNEFCVRSLDNVGSFHIARFSFRSQLLAYLVFLSLGRQIRRWLVEISYIILDLFVIGVLPPFSASYSRWKQTFGGSRWAHFKRFSSTESTFPAPLAVTDDGDCWRSDGVSDT